ncbi:thiol reductant ABC exporter subunit CydC [Longispora albida]|uniref:thiol reductant ABC exporter subunit CydC n=1 Tax=Longispora albida TaxID=203523 RepID=UPI00036557F7|nr:thiol reductant ABC exporter subunit CydC [Longispora albida]
MNNRFLIAWLTGTLAALSAAGLTATAAWLISRAAQHPPVLYLMVAIVAVRTFGIGRGVLRYTERLTGHDAALRILARLRVTVYNHLERDPSTLLGRRAGDLAARYTTDVDTLADWWLRILLPYAAAFATGGAGIALTAWYLPQAAWTLALSLLIVAFGAPWLALRHARTAEARTAPLHGELAASMTTLLRHIGEIIAHGEQDTALASLHTTGKALTHAEQRAASGRGTATALAVLAAGTSVTAALWLAAGTVDPVLLATLVLLPLALHELFAALIPAAAILPRIQAARARIQALETPATPEPAGTLPATYDLRTDNLTARGCTIPDIHIPAGTAHILTGPSGTGKSTLAALAVKLAAPTSGRILLGGTDIATIPGDTLRTTIGLCAQDAHVFDSTLEANLRLAKPDATDAELHAALDAAHLGDWARTLPEGLHTRTGEHGTHLSGGQRQRLTLARALLADFPVIIFDEPAEHLDPRTAAELTRDLLTATAGRTVLLITHQPPPPGIPATSTVTHHDLART